MTAEQSAPGSGDNSTSATGRKRLPLHTPVLIGLVVGAVAGQW